jgi:mannose-6-phosphate isomerase
MVTISLLKNVIQEYAWGSTSAIPDLLGRKNPENKPQAEFWMGDHPKAPSLAYYKGRWVSLQLLIENNPIDILGKKVAERFSNRLPFLFKVLAAAKPLSIQAHPNLKQAQMGFKRENDLKIPLDAANRNYRDANHKPECICALTPFWALSRFRRITEILRLLEQMNLDALKDMLAELKKHPTSNSLEIFYTSLMSFDQDHKNRIVDEALKKAYYFSADVPEFKWMLRLAEHYPQDIGVLSPVLLNLVRLEPRQALYLDAGELHAYLEGLGIELMANSDNVLRGGLTPKHVDVPELLSVLNFTGQEILLLTPEKKGIHERVYHSPAEEFILSTITLDDGDDYLSPEQRSVQIIICTHGKITITDDRFQTQIVMSQGDSVIVPASVTQYRLKGQGICYKAGVPLLR